MGMHNPPHPGEFIREIYMEPFGLSMRKVAGSLNVSPSTLNGLASFEGFGAISGELAGHAGPI
jgi:addiction module HigA family antidote